MSSFLINHSDLRFSVLGQKHEFTSLAIIRVGVTEPFCDAERSRVRNLWVLSQRLYHCATFLLI